MPSQKLKRKKHFTPCESLENEEIFANGIFHFNISRISEHIQNGILIIEHEDIEVEKWCDNNNKNINESHLPTVDTSKPIIQAEISPGSFNIIDGNHRLEKAHRNQIQFIPSYKIRAIQLLDYFIDERGYNAFIDYWNGKLKDIGKFK